MQLWYCFDQSPMTSDASGKTMFMFWYVSIRSLEPTSTSNYILTITLHYFYWMMQFLLLIKVGHPQAATKPPQTINTSSGKGFKFKTSLLLMHEAHLDDVLFASLWICNNISPSAHLPVVIDRLPLSWSLFPHEILDERTSVWQLGESLAGILFSVTLTCSVSPA